MIVVDSSFLVAFFHNNDSQHEKAIEDMKKYDEGKEEFLITEHVLGETATVLLYYNGLKAANDFLEFSKDKCSIQGWDNEDFEATLKTFKNQKNQLSYIDCTVVYLARFLHIPVACYDKNILKAIESK